MCGSSGRRQYCDAIVGVRKHHDFSADQIHQHEQLTCRLQKLNHLAAQYLISSFRLPNSVANLARIADAITALSAEMSLLMTGCEQIVTGESQQPDEILLVIERPQRPGGDDAEPTTDAQPTPEEDDKGYRLKTSRALQLQISSLLLLKDTAVCSSIASNGSSLLRSMQMTQALRRLTKALTRQRNHFHRLGATEPSIKVVIEGMPLAGEEAMLPANTYCGEVEDQTCRCHKSRKR